MNITLRAHADAHLAEPDHRAGAYTDFCDQVNRLIAPERRLGPGEIHVKAIYLISDARNAFGGRVPVEELGALRDLALNVPVLIGHQKHSLPVGRTFRAELVRHDNRTWLKVWFYWLRDRGQGDRLRAEIDGGVVSEASISFAFATPECEECGKDFRFCPHDTGAENSGGFLYRQIQRVLEISLVYRGAVAGTRIVDAGATDNEYTGAKSITPPDEPGTEEHGEGAASPRLTPGFKLWRPPHEDAVAYLSVCDGHRWRHWLMPQFSFPHLLRGARFVIQALTHPPVCFAQAADDSGPARTSTNARGHLLVECAGGKFSGRFVVRPTQLNHNGSQILYRADALFTQPAAETDESLSQEVQDD